MEDRVQVCRYLEIDTDSEAERTFRLILRVTQYEDGITVRRDSAQLCFGMSSRRHALPWIREGRQTLSSVNYIMHSALSRYIPCSLPFTNVGLSLIFRYYCVFIILLMFNVCIFFIILLHEFFSYFPSVSPLSFKDFF